MSTVYLIRHGQAGTRDHYDRLSSAGRVQARLLGEYFRSEGIVFRAAVSGAMQRQQETAAEVRAAYERAGLAFPVTEVRPGWNEFDLEGLFRCLAPRLSQTDASFRAAYERMQEEVAASGADPSAAIHRRWTPCDMRVVESWIRGEHELEGESWSGFCERVRSCDLPTNGIDAENVAVFTSATPAAIWAGIGLDILDDRVLRIAGVLYNTSFCTLRIRGDQVRLFSLNNVPHLTDAALRTHR